MLETHEHLDLLADLQQVHHCDPTCLQRIGEWPVAMGASAQGSQMMTYHLPLQLRLLVVSIYSLLLDPEY